MGCVGSALGLALGFAEGAFEGSGDGSGVGDAEVGSTLGLLLGIAEGANEGCGEGRAVGNTRMQPTPVKGVAGCAAIQPLGQFTTPTGATQPSKVVETRKPLGQVFVVGAAVPCWRRRRDEVGVDVRGRMVGLSEPRRVRRTKLSV